MPSSDTSESAKQRYNRDRRRGSKFHITLMRNQNNGASDFGNFHVHEGIF